MDSDAQDERIDLAIVGCGAAGLMAAAFAGEAAPRGTRIVAFDGAKKIGAKILVAGGGRCNVTHHAVTPDDYFGGSRHTVRKVIGSWPVEQTVVWFAEHGVRLKREDTGKLFPVTDKAQTVLDALLGAVRGVGVELRHPCRVTSIDAGASGGFALRTNGGVVHARRVILATGGRALPRSGSDGAGYGFVRALGHTVTQTTPALVPLKLEDGHWLRGLSGVAVDATLTLWSATRKRLHDEAGPVLFTHFGVSGPAPMNISRHWLSERGRGGTLSVGFTQRSAESLDAMLVDAGRSDGRSTLPRWVAARHEHLPARLVGALLQHGAGIDPATVLSALSREARRSVVGSLTRLPLPIVGDRGYSQAEVTAGGVPLPEIDPATLASRRHPGLWLCGEVLDVDGRIGGFNFQWAWCTGRLAGRSAAGDCE